MVVQYILRHTQQIYRFILLKCIQYLNRKTKHYHLALKIFSDSTSNSTLSCNISKTPFKIQYVIGKPNLNNINISYNVLGMWFHKNPDQFSNTNANTNANTNTNSTISYNVDPYSETIVITKNTAQFHFQRQNDQQYVGKNNNVLNEFSIIESRLSGKPGSLFNEHFPLGIDITEFAQTIFQPTQLEQLIDITLKLYEILPFLLLCISNSYNKQIIYYDKNSLYVSILLDETFELYNIEADTCIFPFSLNTLTSV
jgi:hypothetical protein